MPWPGDRHHSVFCPTCGWDYEEDDPYEIEIGGDCQRPDCGGTIRAFGEVRPINDNDDNNE